MESLFEMIGVAVFGAALGFPLGLAIEKLFQGSPFVRGWIGRSPHNASRYGFSLRLFPSGHLRRSWPRGLEEPCAFWCDFEYTPALRWVTFKHGSDAAAIIEYQAARA